MLSDGSGRGSWVKGVEELLSEGSGSGSWVKGMGVAPG